MTSQGGFPHPEGRNDKLGSASLPCHCEEGASPTWQSQVGTCEFAGCFPIFRTGTARLPRLLRSLAMTSQGGFPHPEGRKGKPKSAFLPCHSEERSDVGISSRHYRIRRGFLVFRACTARLPRLLRSLAMTSQGGFPHPEGRNDKLGSASLPCHCEEGASPTWQSQVGTIEFAGAFLCSGHVLRDCRGSCGASQ